MGENLLLSSIPFIISFLAALFAFVVGSWIWNYINRPILEMENVAKEDEEYVSGEYMFSPHPSHPSREDEEEDYGSPYDFNAITHFVKVSNLGRTSAKNVRVYLRINDDRFKGEKFLLKWKSRESPSSYSYYDGKRTHSETNYEALSDDRLAIDVLPGSENYELLGLLLRRDLWLEEYIEEIRRKEPIGYDARLIYSPQPYYTYEFQKILLSKVDTDNNLKVRVDRLVPDIKAVLHGVLTITYEGPPVTYNVEIMNVSVLCKEPIKVNLRRRSRYSRT